MTSGVATVGAFATVGRSTGSDALAWAQLLPVGVCLAAVLLILRRGRS